MPPRSKRRATGLALVFGGFVVSVVVAHRLVGSTNLGTADQLRLGFLPVTCHLTCPVADFITRNMSGGGTFKPVRFNGWPELKESFLSGKIETSFLLAPLAISLREAGTPIKIVYLGHRDGTALVVHSDAPIRTVAGLRGKRVAVPNRFSNQYLLLHKALRHAGVPAREVEIVEIPPPDMPAALSVKAVDAITSGEPFMGQAELDGYGRVLYQTKDVWPNFISCVLVVHQDLIDRRRPEVQRLVDGIAASGKWLDRSMDNRMDAAQFVARDYYRQDPKLLRFVLSKPPDRVKYSNLALHEADFALIEALGKELGLLKGNVRFGDYADVSFSRKEPEAWTWKPAR